MSMNVNKMNGGGGLDLGDPTMGPHYARLVGFCYIGIHDRQDYNGTPKTPCGKLLFTFELLDDTVEIDGVVRPRWITKKENAFSTSNSNAIKIYNKLDPNNVHGGAFDKLAAATQPCMVTIGPRKDKKGNILDGVRIDEISLVPKAPDGTEYVLAAAQNPVIIFDFDEPTAEQYAALKPWMMNLVKTANDYPGSACERIVLAHEEQEAVAAAAAPAAPAQPETAPVAPPAAAPPAPPAAAPPLAPPAAAPALAPPAPATAPPVAAPPAAPVAPLPVAPPGFRYDEATNSFIPDAQGAAPPPAAPAGGGAY